MKSPAKILLADSSVTMHRAVRLALKKEPYELILTDNGSDALRICQEHNPALVIADLDLTGVTGGELINKLENFPHIKSILLCGNFNQVDEQHLEQIPADARLWKPFESHVLVTLIRTLLQGSDQIEVQQTEKTQAITLDRSHEKTQQLSGNSHPTQEISTDTDRAFEATRPMPRPEKSESSSGPELPFPVPETLEKIHKQVQEKTASSDTNMRDKVLTQNNVKDNLWSTDFDSFKGEIRTEKLNYPTREESATNSQSSNEDYYVLDRTEDDLEVATAALNKHSSQQTKTSLDEQLSVYNELNSDQKEEIKTLVRNEIDRALSTWFKDRLQEKLDEILEMIDDESKK